MLGTVTGLAAMAGGGFLVFRGISLFDCRSVSFSSDLTTCYASDFGSMSGTVAGGGFVAVGVALFLFAMVRLATIK